MIDHPLPTGYCLTFLALCTEPDNPEPRVFHGGSWYNFPEWTRTAARSAFTAEFRGIILGLRLLRELD